MITRKSEREIEEMKKSGKLLASIHEALRDFIKPGVTGMEVDQFFEKRIKEAGGIPAQIGYEGYKYATCVSVNDEICHGFPTDYAFKDGDIVKVDTVIDLDGAFSDSCWCYAVGNISDEAKHLMDVTRKCLYRGIAVAKPGNRIGDIGAVIQEYAESEGFSVVKEFVGHGIGPTMHEEPAIPHYGKANTGLRLRPGMTITIEPMINTGHWKSKIDDNGWTARTIDGGLSAQYEHTIAITEDEPIILTKQKGQ
ncbi:type I methionyl aminopeptidase [Allofustis seminis]|uniref:type I methionyl aminopeptidase n=1 Tax=Allofustis seminis TaxID=166939 RepID=UPI000381F424|nr:type I methionyl aminopeptidase [Allofustis seminis]